MIIEPTESPEDSSVNIESLTVGTHEVNATGAGVTYMFTADPGVTHVITFTDVNAVVFRRVSANESEEITSGYEFTLAKGEPIEFFTATADWNDDTYTITISEKTA